MPARYRSDISRTPIDDRVSLLNIETSSALLASSHTLFVDVFRDTVDDDLVLAKEAVMTEIKKTTQNSEDISRS
jgi:hypothetical protein